MYTSWARHKGEKMEVMQKHLSEMTVEELIREGGIPCSCGKVHSCGLKYFKAGQGVISLLPEAMKDRGRKHPMVVMDANTQKAAGDAVRGVLDAAGIPHTDFVFPETNGKMEPDEYAVGALTMAVDPACDVILAVGSGVINDCCKVVAHACRLPSMVVCTAPSMDGYCSNSASMIRDHIKVSLYNACPEAIIADTDILATAPDRMLQAGLGDMLAKYVSVCEWRISHLVHGDPYCEEIAGMVRACLKKIVDHAGGLMKRDPGALKAVLEGLVISGISMAFAEISRPASGLEHYFSHMWEMQALQRGEPSDLHGIQVGTGTLLTLWIYEHMLDMEKPDAGKARLAMQAFSQVKWEERMKDIFGPVSGFVIGLEKTVGKNRPETQEAHLKTITENWELIRRIISEELPSRDTVYRLMTSCGMPLTPADLGLSRKDTVDALLGSREIRDKYLTSSLLWDLGLLEETAETLPCG
ncbi:MAG: sn-glycerol-1-phosphate dehydrogenase [Clostridiales bacterium]|nr:sn-glycerol-1-phosphate dehydrogenase [Clostridiales bacterium]